MPAGISTWLVFTPHAYRIIARRYFLPGELGLTPQWKATVEELLGLSDMTVGIASAGCKLRSAFRIPCMSCCPSWGFAVGMHVGDLYAHSLHKSAKGGNSVC